MRFLALMTAFLFFVACGKDDHEGNGHDDDHEHEAKHGGDMIELGDHEGFMEVWRLVGIVVKRHPWAATGCSKSQYGPRHGGALLGMVKSATGKRGQTRNRGRSIEHED